MIESDNEDNWRRNVNESEDDTRITTDDYGERKNEREKERLALSLSLVSITTVHLRSMLTNAQVFFSITSKYSLRSHRRRYQTTRFVRHRSSFPSIFSHVHSQPPLKRSTIWATSACLAPAPVSTPIVSASVATHFDACAKINSWP